MGNKNYKQLFFDDQKLLVKSGFIREYGTPQMIKESVYQDPNFEVTAGMPSVWKAPDGKYHMFYQGTPAENDPENLTNLEDGNIVLAAISDDGIHFVPRNTAREAGIENPIAENQVLDYFIGDFCGLFVDDNADESERLKMLIDVHDEGLCHLVNQIYVSSDGIHWKIKRDCIWNPFGSECGWARYSPITSEYLITTRPDGGDRRVALCKTRDWVHFSGPDVILQCDSEEESLCEIYQMPFTYYEGMFIGFLSKYHNDSHHATKFQGGRITCELAYSYNGSHWLRSLRHDFLNGTTGNSQEVLGYERKMVYPTDCYSDKDGNIIIFSHGSSGEHGIGFRTKHAGTLCQYILRQDDFIHLKTENAEEPALLCTRDNRWLGGELSVNLICKNATMAIYNRDNQIIEGYSHDDCCPFSGDSTNWNPVWKNGKTMDMLTDCIVQLEISLTDGILYSFSGKYEPMMDLQSSRWLNWGRDTYHLGY